MVWANYDPTPRTGPWMPEILEDRVFIDPNTGDWATRRVGNVPSVTAAELGVTEQFLNQIQLLHPWMDGTLIAEYVGAYTSEDYGSHELALEYLRTTDAYQARFPGLRREDGSLRMTESEYFSYVEAIRSDLGQYVNPELFNDQIVGLLEGDVSYAEFSQRFNTVVERVLMQAPAIQAAYAENLGVNLTSSAMIAAALNPQLGDAILNRQITMAEVAGTADQRGFDLDSALTERLVEQGIDLRSSRDLFNRAREIVPIIDVLAARHNDPDEDFTIEDFLSSDVFSDPQERNRMRRLLEAESSLFVDAPTFTAGRSGEISGLRER